MRERTLRGINSLPALWAGKGSTKLLLSALADDDARPAAAGPHAGLDQARILDPARRARVPQATPGRSRRRRSACWLSSTVEQHGLDPGTKPALARRVKALAADPALKARALDLLDRQRPRSRRRSIADVPLEPAPAPELLDLPAQGQPALLSSR